MDESELDELLQRAIDPYVPVELFYAVLDRIGRFAATADPEPEPEFALELEAAPPSDADLLPDATMLMEQVDQLEAAMAGE